MKTLITTALLLLIVNISYSQIKPYVDLGVAWELPLSGKLNLDAGINIRNISIEANSMVLGHSRLGGSIGYQLGERGSDFDAMRVYGGSVYGKFFEYTKTDCYVVKKWQPMIGAKWMMGSGCVDLRAIPNFKNLLKGEYYVVLSIQVVEVVKWIWQ